MSIWAGTGLESFGFGTVATVHRNLGPTQLVESIIRRGEGALSKDGAIISNTGKYTGRSPNDKFVIEEASSKGNIWWGKHNRAFPEDKFDALLRKVGKYLADKEIFVQDLFAGTDPEYRLPIRVINQKAWHNLFARNMFVRPQSPNDLAGHTPQFTVVHVPDYKADPAADGTASEAFVLLNFGKRIALIGGTQYAGEVKKSIFTVLNYLLPLKGVMSMHCSANIGKSGDTAIFFGLSGTGKTTLSADPHRGLIGDDEHGWSANGVFNYEGGCYAKVIRLSKEAEPEIWDVCHRFGTILENVVYDEDTRALDLDSDKLTENTRASYPIDFIPNAVLSGRGGQPKNIMMLTYDAFGVLPPISRLTPDQAMYHFVSGYTAKVAGTERGITEPQPNFSTCFGAPFMALHPSQYARLLKKKMQETQAICWLVNTGLTGGPYGTGKRMSIKHTRALVNAALDGRLANSPTQQDPIFGFQVPTQAPDVPNEVLLPRNTWANKEDYDKAARALAQKFHDNFKQFDGQVDADLVAGAPPAK